MSFCPKCKDEYRERFTICKDCDTSLTDSLLNEIYTAFQEKNEHEQSKAKIRNTISICCMMVSIVLMMLPYGMINGPSNFSGIFYMPHVSSSFMLPHSRFKLKLKK